jgi:CheY-like chemotaxis protein
VSKRILVVEDQPDNRQIIRDMLAPTDYEITEAESGEEALEAIAKQRPDLILIDIQLPIIDRVCRHAQNQGRPRVGRRRRHARRAAMITFRNRLARANCWRKFGSTCPNRSRSIAYTARLKADHAPLLHDKVDACYPSPV